MRFQSVITYIETCFVSVLKTQIYQIVKVTENESFLTGIDLPRALLQHFEPIRRLNRIERVIACTTDSATVQ